MIEAQPTFWYKPEQADVHQSDIQRCESPILSCGEGAVYIKQLNSAERKNFELIDKYRLQLLDGNLLVIFPTILECDANNLCTMTSPAHFHHDKMYGHDVATYKAVLSALNLLRSTLNPDDFSDTPDPDSDSIFFPFIEKVLGDIQGYFPQSNDLLQIFHQTQKVIEELPLLPSHGDAHNQNWSVAYLNNIPVVSFIDLETLGSYRVGWDEGRMYSLLSGKSDDQKNLLEAIYSTQHFSAIQELNFWRTVAVRCTRDIQLIIRNKRFTHLDEIQKYEKIFEYLTTLEESMQNLQSPHQH